MNKYKKFWKEKRVVNEIIKANIPEHGVFSGMLACCND